MLPGRMKRGKLGEREGKRGMGREGKGQRKEMEREGEKERGKEECLT